MTRIGVDGWRLAGRRTGVGTYLLRVLREWDSEMLDQDEKVTVYASTPMDPADLLLPRTIEQRVVGPDWSMLPWQSLRLGPTTRDDVLFCPSFSAPLWTRPPTVVVIFEATQRLFPEEYPLRTRFIDSPLYALGGRRASRVIAPTNAARDDVAKCYGVPHSKIDVIPLAPAEVFKPFRSESDRESARRRVLGNPDPYFIHVGKLTPRRNVPTLLRAFARFREAEGTDHRLVVVGLPSPLVELDALAQELRLGDSFVHLHYVDEDDLVALYAAAEAFVLPYTYEAASLTAIEAQAAGTPVVVTETPGLREQTGGAALFLRTVSEAEIADSLATLAKDPSLRSALREEGLSHAGSLSWRSTARATLDVLREAATESQHA